MFLNTILSPCAEHQPIGSGSCLVMRYAYNRNTWHRLRNLKKVTMDTKTKDSCPICDGQGVVTVECYDCEGSGEYSETCPECDGHPDEYGDGETCTECDGSGFVFETCPTCDGEGEIEEECEYCSEKEASP